MSIEPKPTRVWSTGHRRIFHVRIGHALTGWQSAPARAGLAAYRQVIETMVSLKHPPCHTVHCWYLFNLIRLPTGSRGFASGERGGDGYGGYQ